MRFLLSYTMSYQYKGNGRIQLTGNNMSNWSGILAQPNTIYTGPQISINGNASPQYGNVTINSVGKVSYDYSYLNQNITRYEIIESRQDIIALSTCWNRIRNNQSIDPTYISIGIITSMIDDTLFSQVNEDDISYANTIRDYYIKKITVLALKNVELSSFRKELKELVNSDGKKFKETIIPLVYRLPEFYEYDLAFEDLIFNHNRELKNFNHTDTIELTMDLSLVKTFKVNNKRQKRKEYWFKDIHNNLVTYFIDASNPLIGLLDKLVENDITVTGKFKKRDRDGHEFIKMHSLKFI